VAALWDRLGVGAALRKTLGEDSAARHGRALQAIVVNRMVAPTSKLGVAERWLEGTWTGSSEPLSEDALYRAMDAFGAHAEQIEESVFFAMSNLLNLVVDVILYDTTTVSFSIDEEDEFRRYGHSKEGGTGPQMVVALAVTREGYPVRSWVFPGNTADESTIATIRADLRGWRLGRTLLVGDAGMDSTDNRALLARAAGRFVLATRLDRKEVEDDVLGRAGRYREVEPNLRVKEVVVGDGVQRRRYVLCHNPAEEARQAARREQVLVELDQELASHPKRDARAKWVAQLRASGRYGRYLSVDAAGEIHVDRDKIERIRRQEGKWVLITNDDTLSPEEIGRLYRAQMVIERCFRTLKTTRLRLRPVFHFKRSRVESHVKLCVLALLFERIIEDATALSGAAALHALSSIELVDVRTAEGRFLQRTHLRETAAFVLDRRHLAEPPAVVIPA
jgi:transposase